MRMDTTLRKKIEERKRNEEEISRLKNKEVSETQPRLVNIDKIGRLL